jgi:small-conductance mechanosensitive channel
LFSLSLSSDNLLYRLRKKDKAYKDSITFQIVETVSEAARLAAVCYVLDTVEVALEVTGIKGQKMDISSLLAKLIFATWAGLRTRMYKRRFFANLVNFTPKQLNGRKGILEVFDKTSDFFGFGILALVWTDILKIKGHGLSSIFALGGFGTLTLTLACQDLAKRALNGLALSASDSFEVGDQILLGDGELNVYCLVCYSPLLLRPLVT